MRSRSLLAVRAVLHVGVELCYSARNGNYADLEVQATVYPPFIYTHAWTVIKQGKIHRRWKTRGLGSSSPPQIRLPGCVVPATTTTQRTRPPGDPITPPRARYYGS